MFKDEVPAGSACNVVKTNRPDVRASSPEPIDYRHTDEESGQISREFDLLSPSITLTSCNLIPVKGEHSFSQLRCQSSRSVVSSFEASAEKWRGGGGAVTSTRCRRHAADAEVISASHNRI